MLGQPRYHRPRWGLLLYYPQTVHDDMGPTKIQPGSQFLFGNFGNPTPGAALPPAHRLTVEAGTVVIAHYELFHGATAHTSDRNRQMHKLLVVRTDEPSPRAGPAPSAFWESGAFRVSSGEELAPLSREHTQDGWTEADAAARTAAAAAAAAAGAGAVARGHAMLSLRAIWTTVWRWWCGVPVGPGPAGYASLEGQNRGSLDELVDTSVAALSEALVDETTPVSVTREAADRLAFGAVLGRIGDAAAACAAAARGLRSPDEVVRLNCAYALGALADVPALLSALDVEGRLRQQPALEDGRGRCYDGGPESGFTSPSQLDSVYGLAAAGAAARPALLDTLRGVGGPAWWSRAGVGWALAELGWVADGTAATLAVLSDAVNDDNEWVARNVIAAIGTAIGGPEHQADEATAEAASAAAVALAEALLSSREDISPWSLGPSPLKDEVGAALFRLQRARGGAALPERVMESVRRSIGVEGEYVRYWLLRMAGAGGSGGAEASRLEIAAL